MWWAVAISVLAACGPAPAPQPPTTSPPPVSQALPSVGEGGLAIVAIDPPTGDVDGGTYATVKGTRFTAAGPREAKIFFGERPGTVVRFQSDGELIVQAPGGTLNETVDVTLVFEPGGKLMLPRAFTFVTRVP